MNSMCKISVVMPVYNSEKYVGEAIKSVLAQSFDNFEFIIVDDGSTDNTYSVIQSFTDKRIRLIQNKHDFIESLNIGMDTANGTYIARMDADDIMHIDRLKVQYAVMQEYPDVTVCGTWANTFGSCPQSYNLSGAGSVGGLVEKPILKLIQGNFLFHPTIMLRANFLRKKSLKYESYSYAEDYKLWSEIAKSGGQFYVENQPLLYYRISDNQVSSKYRDEQKKTTELIITEIIEYLIEQNAQEYPELSVIYNNLYTLQEKQLFTKYEISALFQNLFSKNDKKLNL